MKSELGETTTHTVKIKCAHAIRIVDHELIVLIGYNFIMLQIDFFKKEKENNSQFEIARTLSKKLSLFVL